MIHCESVSDVYSNEKMIFWFTSAFKSGFINSAGFLISGKFVSHVTGFGTQMGIAMGHSDYFFGAELLIIPCSFILGGVITSFILEDTKKKNSNPSYHYVQGLITFLIGILIILGESKLVSSDVPFDQDQNYNVVEFVIIGLLCLICGLKNSLVTWATYGKIRVTHMTGNATDIGLHLLSLISPRHQESRFKENKIINIYRMGILVSFSMGALISAIVFPTIGYKAFLIVFGISLCMTFFSFYDNKRREAVGELKRSF